MKKKQWIKASEDVLARTLFVKVADNETIPISLDEFTDEDVTRLAFQGLLIKIQRATAGFKDRKDKENVALKKARELSNGQLTSTRTSIVNVVTAKAIAAMRDAGMTDEQIKKAFPEWEG